MVIIYELLKASQKKSFPVEKNINFRFFFLPLRKNLKTFLRERKKDFRGITFRHFYFSTFPTFRGKKYICRCIQSEVFLLWCHLFYSFQGTNGAAIGTTYHTIFLTFVSILVSISLFTKEPKVQGHPILFCSREKRVKKREHYGA